MVVAFSFLTVVRNIRYKTGQEGLSFVLSLVKYIRLSLNLGSAAHWHVAGVYSKLNSGFDLNKE